MHYNWHSRQDQTSQDLWPQSALDVMAMEGRAAAASRPLVLPEPFNREGSWREWNSTLTMCPQSTAGMMTTIKWLKVRLTGRAQVAFQRLPAEARSDFEQARRALQLQFDPPSRKSRYQAELQLRNKKAESWANLADDLHTIAKRAYPDLSDEAKETLAYLAQLDDPQVA